ncbi:MAG: nickel pincer cofactor biosynthesis protein LarC [Ilumatobacteraceae bacterium]|nr:nickel pincer cofactor biosynthesis protein LarC [Ilumatobacteraceae bacterium]
MSDATVQRTAWFHCFAGTAGDMTMAALVHAGADPMMIGDLVGRLGIDGYALTFEPALRCGIAATKATVVVDGGHEHEHRADDPHADQHDHDHGDHDHDHGDADHHDQHADHRAHDHVRDHGDGHSHDGDHEHPRRPYREIRKLLEEADLPPRVKDRATRTFRALAEVEGVMHRMDPDDVELHEVGAVDAIVDIVGACAALESLGIDRIVCSPITVGQGTVRSAHGELPNPAPATLELLARRGAPSRGIADRKELATPTGVALMTALADAFGPMPAMHVAATGYGAGTADIPGRPNVVQVVIGTEAAPTGAADLTPEPGQPVQLFETNVDDATGEVIAHTIAALLAAGAHDAWATPIVMKKGRPGHTVHALCDPATAAAVSRVLVRETGSLGLRGTVLQRLPQQPEERTVVV